MGSQEEMQKAIRQQEERIKELERLLQERDELIQELYSKLDKYQSVVLVPTTKASFVGFGYRRQGIAAEPQTPPAIQDLDRDAFRVIAKPQSSQDLLRQGIVGNEFLQNLSAANIRDIVDCMFEVEYKKDSVIIKEGDPGSRVYAIEEGKVEVTKEGHVLSTMGPGKVFGELAVLYNCARTATVRAMTICKLWAIERSVFQGILIRAELLRQKENAELLRKIPRFQNESDDVVEKIAEMAEERFYKINEHLVRQGDKNETFYIISKGKVKETKRGSVEESLVRTLSRGDFFGENALDGEDIRTTTITANDSQGVQCLTIDRRALSTVLCLPPYNERKSMHELDGSSDEWQEPSLDGTALADFKIITTLGVGGFSRVNLIQLRDDVTKTFALKQMKKHHIVETRQQEHIMNEKNIMIEARSNFIVRLYKTFRDNKYLYMLLEPCLGGELWTLLRDKNCFDEAMTRFYAGCVVESLYYLHCRGIVYRDLKPENLLMDEIGYIKLVDFGFAKKVGHGRKTWTFCGTPEYVPPEVILSRGHDTSCDLWSLGILIFELLTGSPPFNGADPMKTYNLILRGIDTVDFPKIISKNAQGLIKKLCRDNPADRLGFGSNGFKDIRRHKWFELLNWDALQKRIIKAPYIPTVKDQLDTSNFDSYPAEEGGEPPDDLTGWDEDF